MRGDKFQKKVVLAEHDGTTIQRPVLPETEQEYKDVLRIFDGRIRFVKDHSGAVTPPDLQTFKAFMEYISINIEGRIKEHPTVATVDGWRRCLQSALRHQRGVITPGHVKTTVQQYIKTVLKHKILLSDAQREKGGLSPNDLAILMTQLWCQDSLEYRGRYPDRTRIQLSAALLLYCFTSARAGEVHESTRRRRRAQLRMENMPDKSLNPQALSACYKHFQLTLEWVDGHLMLVLLYQRAFVKRGEERTEWDLPVHLFYNIYSEKLPLFFNLLVFFLPMASADRAFRDYDRVADILDEVEAIARIGPTEAKVARTIHFKESVLETPVFRQYTECDINDSTGKSRGADAFSKQCVNLGHHSGFRININAGASRRWALQEADPHHSQTARMKFAGHFNPTTFPKWYAHPISDVDGLATFLNIPGRTAHIKNHRSMAVHYSPYMLQSLPAKQMFEFEARNNIRELTSGIKNIKLEVLQEDDDTKKQLLHSKRRQLEKQKSRAYHDELTRLRKADMGESKNKFQETLFQYHSRVMPERRSLAEILPTSVELRSPDGRKALCALEALCIQERGVLYRSGLAPNRENCVCGIYARMGPDRFARYCFECDFWCNKRAKWSQHCQEHLDNPEELLRCDLIMFHNVPVKAALCPFCMGDTFLGAALQMDQFLDSPKWWDHVESHLEQKARTKDFHCCHPACDIRFDSIKVLRFHLEDVHHYKPPRGTKRPSEN
ncbi:hypothetical protein BDW59DRAFT_176992 [Aspergillus cavernicola]|uniref:C2H2-type domain-containing protein n=1 Tax=Aspergillus cavernicola TaxID=176166 RepID=A0ABR4HA48_9EURO